MLFVLDSIVVSVTYEEALRATQQLQLTAREHEATLHHDEIKRTEFAVYQQGQ